MRIRILRNTVCNGVVVEAGNIIETDEDTAKLLIMLRKATPESRTIEPPETAVVKTITKRSKKNAQTGGTTGG